MLEVSEEQNVDGSEYIRFDHCIRAATVVDVRKDFADAIETDVVQH